MVDTDLRAATVRLQKTLEAIAADGLGLAANTTEHIETAREAFRTTLGESVAETVQREFKHLNLQGERQQQHQILAERLTHIEALLVKLANKSANDQLGAWAPDDAQGKARIVELEEWNGRHREVRYAFIAVMILLAGITFLFGWLTAEPFTIWLAEGGPSAAIGAVVDVIKTTADSLSVIGNSDAGQE